MLSLRDLLRAAAAGAIALASLHLLSAGALVLPAFLKSAEAVRAATAGIAPHVLLFHLKLLACVAVFGAIAGATAFAMLAALGLATPLRAGISAILATIFGGLYTMAVRPALFEDLLWRRGGVAARAQVFVVEKLGALGVETLAFALVMAWAFAAAYRHRRDGRAVLVGMGVLALAFALVNRPALHAKPARPDAQAIVVLAADSLRPDRFSSEGNPHRTTPAIDALRAQGLWADDFFVPIASTTASWASLLTGAYPHAHGIRDLFPRDEQAKLRLPSLPALLQARGFETAVVSDYAGESFSRVDMGFQHVDAPPATTLEVVAEREAFQKLPLALALFAGPLGQRLFPVAGYLPVNANPRDLTARVEAQLDRLEASGKPFLLVAFYSVTHSPFAAPMPQNSAFTDRGYRGQSRYSYEIQQIDDIGRAAVRPPDADVEQVRALYDGALLAFDGEVRRITERLKKDGLTNCSVVISGDHGESLFEPGATTEHGKWFMGGESANRTALLLSGPRIHPGRIAGVSSGIDFAPTLLALAGAPAPSSVEGVSLLANPPAERTVFAESTVWLSGKQNAPPHAITYPPVLQLLEVSEATHALQLKQRYQEITVTARLRAARRGSFELIYTPRDTLPPLYQLFDLKRDPFAEHDLHREALPIEAALRDDLLEFLRRDRLRWLDAADRVVERIEE